MDTPDKGSAQDTGRALSAPKPIVTWVIVGITTLCFLLQLIPGLSLATTLGFVPALALEQPWRALTVVLVHDHPSPIHLAGNMIGLYFFGTFVERALGHGRFLIIYLLGAIGGSTMVFVLADPFSSEWLTLNIGASGAVFAIFGVLLAPTRRLDRNIGGVVIFLLLNLGYGFLVPGVSWQAHLGGMVSGFVLGCAALLVPRRHSLLVFTLVALGWVVLLGLGDVWRMLSIM